MALTSQECGQLMAFMQRTPLEGKESMVHAVLTQRLQQEAQEALKKEQSGQVQAQEGNAIPDMPPTPVPAD